MKPSSAIAQRQFAEALRVHGEVDAAIAAFHEAIRLEPNEGSAHYHLALALEKKGDLDGAIAEFRAAMQLDTTRHASWHQNFSRVLRAWKDIKGAVAEARSIPDRARQPRRAPRAGPGLGDSGGPGRGAVAAFRAANPEPALALAEYSRPLRANGKRDEALAAARESVRLGPGFEFTHRVLGWALLDKSEWAESASVSQGDPAQLRHILELQHSRELHRTRAGTHGPEGLRRGDSRHRERGPAQSRPLAVPRQSRRRVPGPGETRPGPGRGGFRHVPPRLRARPNPRQPHGSAREQGSP